MYTLIMNHHLTPRPMENYTVSIMGRAEYDTDGSNAAATYAKTLNINRYNTTYIHTCMHTYIHTYIPPKGGITNKINIYIYIYMYIHT